MVRFTTNGFRIFEHLLVNPAFLKLIGTLYPPSEVFSCTSASGFLYLLQERFTVQPRWEENITAVNTSNCKMSQTFSLSSRWWLYDQGNSDPSRQREELTQTTAGTCKMAQQGKALAAKPFCRGCIPSVPRVERVNWLPLVAFWSPHKHCANHEYSWNISLLSFLLSVRDQGNRTGSLSKFKIWWRAQIME